MAKRSLSMLLAIVALFSLAVPAFAADEVLGSGTFGAEGNNLTWTMTKGGVVTISGKGEMEDFEPGGGDVPYSSAGGCSVEKVIVESGVTSIGDWAFAGFNWLKSVTIPATVTSIGQNAFQYALPDEINVASGNPKYVSVDGVLYTADMKKLVAYPCGREGNYAVPEGVTEIPASCFCECAVLTGITFPSTLEKIGEHAFLYCWSLSGDLVFPASVSSIGDLLLQATDVNSVTILNPTCSIEGGEYTFCDPDSTVIKGYDGSTAEAYAKEYGYTFKSLGKAPSASTPTAKPSSQLTAPAVKISKVSNGIQATWSAVSGSPFYMVYYRENGGSWQKIGSTYKTSYTHPASKLKNGVTYQFTVRCCGNDRKTLLGGYTASNSLTYVSQLTAPTVKISKVSNGIQVSWNAVSGSPRYMVYYRENNGSWKKIGTTDKSSYTHAASKLKNGVTYQFTVRCCASDRKTLLSGYTASNSLTYSSQLTAPTVKISKVSNGIQASWSAVSGSPFYMVYYRENGGSWHAIGSTYKTSYTHPASKLKNGVTYQFTVRCCGNDRKTLLGSYTPSNSLTYVSQLAAPTVTIAQTNSGIEASWKAVSGSPFYMVYYRENGGSWHAVGSTYKTSYTHPASKLKSGVTYQFTVRCCGNDRKTLLGGYAASNSVVYQ